MDETIKILREQAVLCSHLPELFDALIKVIVSNSPAVQEPVSKIEAIIRDLSKNERKAQEFLKRVGASSFAEYINFIYSCSEAQSLGYRNKNCLL